jgi:hypothetical protein
MAFKHACFVSYVQGEGALMREFINELRDALSSELEPFVDEDVFMDRTHIPPGADLEVAIARALCESASWMIVYVPKYGRHEWCRREFAAMIELERQRRELFGSALDDGKRLWVPVILRGEVDTLPPPMRGSLVIDFSRFTTAETSILRNPDYVAKMMTIATYINDLCEIGRETPANFSAGCSQFQLPPAGEPWGHRQRLPTRAGL